MTVTYRGAVCAGFWLDFQIWAGRVLQQGRNSFSLEQKWERNKSQSEKTIFIFYFYFLFALQC